MTRTGNTGFLKRAVKEVKKAGIKGDTELAHVNPEEKALLKARGGAGTRNPRTGLVQYYDGVAGEGSEGSGTTGAADGGFGGADVGGVDPAASQAAANEAIDNAAAGGLGLGGLGGFGAEPGFGTDPGFADNPTDQSFTQNVAQPFGIKGAINEIGKPEPDFGKVAMNAYAGFLGLAVPGIGLGLGVTAIADMLGVPRDQDQSPKGGDPNGVAGGGYDQNPAQMNDMMTQQQAPPPASTAPDPTQTPAAVQEVQTSITNTINQELGRYYDRFGDGGPPRVTTYVDPATGQIRYKYG